MTDWITVTITYMSIRLPRVRQNNPSVSVHERRSAATGPRFSVNSAGSVSDTRTASHTIGTSVVRATTTAAIANAGVCAAIAPASIANAGTNSATDPTAIRKNAPRNAGMRRRVIRQVSPIPGRRPTACWFSGYAKMPAHIPDAALDTSTNPPAPTAMRSSAREFSKSEPYAMATTTRPITAHSSTVATCISKTSPK